MQFFYSYKIYNPINLVNSVSDTYKKMISSTLFLLN